MTQKTPPNSGKWDQRAASAGRLIGAAARAKRVVLFGSTARGEAGPRSDWDFLVVIPARRHRNKASVRGWQAVRDSDIQSPPMDILVMREKEVERLRHSQYSVVKHALDEGIDVWPG